jgi:hypothetical protein
MTGISTGAFTFQIYYLVRNIAYTLGTEKRTDQARATLDFSEVLLDTILELLVLL